MVEIEGKKFPIAILPDGKEMEYPDFVVVDIVKHLPVHKTKKYRKRSLNRVDRVIVHHKAGGTMPGMAGAIATANYIVKWKKDKWAGHPYHFDVPYEPLRVQDGRLVVLQTQHIDTRCYHTGGHNHHGIGVAFQGLFGSSGYPSGSLPGDEQIRLLPLLHRAICDGWGIEWKMIFGHADYGKAACPGDYLFHMIKHQIRMEDDSIALASWAMRKEYLHKLGYLGRYKPDEAYDEEVRAAVDNFREDAEVPGGDLLPPWDPATERAVIDWVHEPK